MIPETLTESFPLPKRLLVVMAHPDDPEFFAGGTLATWASKGVEIHVLILTDGSKGSDDPEMTPERLIALRRDEQRAASAEEGIAHVMFLDYPDGELAQFAHQAQRDVARVIRQLQPDALLTMDPSVIFTQDDRIAHIDHRTAGQIGVDVGKIAAGNRLYYPDLLAAGLAPHQVREIYVVAPAQPNCQVDISGHVDAKIAALRAHRSQIKDMARVEKRFRTPNAKNSDGSDRWVEKLRRFVLV